MEAIQVLIFNHRKEVVQRFSRHGAALKHYQDGLQKPYVEELSQSWFSLSEACIVAHHAAVMEDDDQKINVLVAVNPHFQTAKKEFIKPKGKTVRYLYIFFEAEEQEARAFVYQQLRPTIFENHPVRVQVMYHQIGFI